MAPTLTFDEDPPRWLYRGVPIESPEVAAVRADGEVAPRRSDRSGVRWRENHTAGHTDTNYTSWTDDRSIAVELAQDMAESQGLCGRIVVFRVAVDQIDDGALYDGRADESEYLIEGRVENVSFSVEEDAEEEDLT